MYTVHSWLTEWLTTFIKMCSIQQSPLHGNTVSHNAMCSTWLSFSIVTDETEAKLTKIFNILSLFDFVFDMTAKKTFATHMPYLYMTEKYASMLFWIQPWIYLTNVYHKILHTASHAIYSSIQCMQHVVSSILFWN